MIVINTDKLLNYISVRFYMPFLPGYIKDLFSFTSEFKNKRESSKETNQNLNFLSNYTLEEKEYYETIFSKKNDLKVNGVSKGYLKNLKKIIPKDIFSVNSDFKSDTKKSKEYFYNTLGLDKSITDYQWFFGIAFDEKLNKYLEKSFGNLFFCGGGVYLSKPVKNKSLSGSQKWHIDRFSNTHVKVFINLSKIESDQGPTIILSKKNTQKIIGNIFTLIKNKIFNNDLYKKYKDILKGGLSVRNYNKLSNINDIGVDNIGDIGTTIIGNTGLCLHQGSRCVKGERKILLLHYCKRIDYVKDQVNDKKLGIKTRFLNIEEKEFLSRKFGRYC